MTRHRLTAAALGAALLVPALAVVAPANAISDKDTTIKDIAVQCYGVENFGVSPLVDLAGSEIAKAYEDMVSCGTMRKVTRKTIKIDSVVGTKANIQGYRCEVTKIKRQKPTGAKTKWECEFRGADTATEIYVKFWQFAD